MATVPPAHERVLASVRRLDPGAQRVLVSASEATLYVFRLDGGSSSGGGGGGWRRDIVQGPVVLVRRSVRPFARLFVLNLKDVSYHSEDVMSAVEADGVVVFEAQVMGKFLMFRSFKGVRALWFADVALMQKLEKELNKILSVTPNELKALQAQEERKRMEEKEKGELRSELMRLVMEDRFIDTVYADFTSARANQAATVAAPVHKSEASQLLYSLSETGTPLLNEEQLSKTMVSQLLLTTPGEFLNAHGDISDEEE